MSAAARSLVTRLAPLVVLAVLAALPYLDVRLPGVLPGLVSSPGALQVLGIALVYAGIAVSYDIVFGYAGLLSFGHALFVALGVYSTNLLMERAELTYVVAAIVATVFAATVAAVLGAIALKARGIALAMVTLAFAEALSIFLLTDPLDMTGGDEGLAIVSSQLPDALRGVANIRFVFWLALGYCAFVIIVAAFIVGSQAGRVWRAIRENEDRVELLGLVPYPFKLIAFVVGGALAGLGGSVYLVLARGASPSIAGADFTLALLIMVVIGGAGRIWGAAIGGLVYGILTLRVHEIAKSGGLAGLPDWIERTVSEPQFILGMLFIALVLFAPGGLASLVERLRLALKRPTG